jgi:hypothetical protein
MAFRNYDLSGLCCWQMNERLCHLRYLRLAVDVVAMLIV